jgi:hypothetical protein
VGDNWCQLKVVIDCEDSSYFKIKLSAYYFVKLKYTRYFMITLNFDVLFNDRGDQTQIDLQIILHSTGYTRGVGGLKKGN